MHIIVGNLKAQSFSSVSLLPSTLIFLDKVPILSFLVKGYYFQQITL